MLPHRVKAGRSDHIADITQAAAMQQSIAIYWGMYCRIFASSWRGL